MGGWKPLMAPTAFQKNFPGFPTPLRGTNPLLPCPAFVENLTQDVRFQCPGLPPPHSIPLAFFPRVRFVSGALMEALAVSVTPGRYASMLTSSTRELLQRSFKDCDAMPRNHIARGG